MNRREFLVRCLIGASTLGVVGKWFGLDSLLTKYDLNTTESSVIPKKNAYYRIVVLGDPHLPVREREIKNPAKQNKIIQAKHSMIDDINTWEDVNEIAVLGDIAAQFGIESEYTYAKEYFSRLQKPISIISGNHDYVYADTFSPKGKFIHGDTVSRERKLNQFKKTFGLNSLFYSHQIDQYQLIFLSPDSLQSHHLTEMSELQIEWFHEQLKQHPHSPTIVFFHAPLKDTLLNYNKTANTPDFIAQPESKIDQILKENPQIRLWVSGHTHTPATNESYASDKLNTYAGHVKNIHTPDMDREIIWTNSLYLYTDKIVVRTFNHKSNQWEDALDRTIYI